MANDENDVEIDGTPVGDEPEDAADDDDLVLEADTEAADPLVDAAEAVGVEEEVAEAEEAPRRGKRGASGDPLNEQARRNLRVQLESDVDAFLRKGGKIEAVPMDVRTDLPKKPESKYGSRSI